MKRRRSKLTDPENFYNHRICLGIYADQYGVKEAMAAFQCSRETARYWKKKLNNDFWMNYNCGGTRTSKFSLEQMLQIEAEILEFFQINPRGSYLEVKEYLKESLDIDISTTYICDISTKRLGLSYKKSEYRNILKYSEENMDYYPVYLLWVYDIDWIRIHFVDECHYDERKLKTPMIHFPKGKKSLKVLQPGNMRARVNCFLMTNLRDEVTPVYISLHEQTNNQFSFGEFILEAIENGVFLPGDYLIMDNVRLHFGKKAWQILGPIDECGINVRRLPTYSPELNACELVFSDSKAWLMQH